MTNNDESILVFVYLQGVLTQTVIFVSIIMMMPFVYKGSQRAKDDLNQGLTRLNMLFSPTLPVKANKISILSLQS